MCVGGGGGGGVSSDNGVFHKLIFIEGRGCRPIASGVGPYKKTNRQKSRPSLARQ